MVMIHPSFEMIVGQVTGKSQPTGSDFWSATPSLTLTYPYSYSWPYPMTLEIFAELTKIDADGLDFATLSSLTTFWGASIEPWKV